jgi:hypothetical protein
MESHEWTFSVKGREHCVEMEYFPADSTVVVALDGTIVYDAPLDRSGLARFALDGREAAVYVKKEHSRYAYDLIVSGISYTTRKPFTPPLWEPLPAVPASTPMPASGPARAAVTRAKSRPRRQIEFLDETPGYAKFVNFVVSINAFTFARKIIPECHVGSESMLWYGGALLLLLAVLTSFNIFWSRQAVIPGFIRFLVSVGLIPLMFCAMFVVSMIVAGRVGTTVDCSLLNMDLYYTINGLR